MGSEIKSDRIARYLELIAEERASGTLDEIFQRMAGGETLANVCQAWDVPYGRMLTWLMASGERYAVYQRALEVAAHELVSETISIADDADPEQIAHAKLRVDTRFRIAKHHAPEVYGEKAAADTGGLPVLGDSTARAAAALLRKMAEKLERVPAPEPIDVTPTVDEQRAA